MDLSAFVIRIAFLALPGLLASALYRKARGRITKKPWEDFLEVMIFSLMSYLLLALVISCNNYIRKNQNKTTVIKADSETNPEVSNNTDYKCWPELTIFNAFCDDKVALNWQEIGYASIIGLILAGIASYIHSYNAITWLLRKIRATRRVADEDIWELFHNSRKADDWLFIRDHKLNLVYFGCITFFSDSEKDRELVIEDVSVFDENSKLLYECPGLYISRNEFDLTMELRNNKQAKDSSSLSETNEEEGA